jgi:hypothetical protein
MLTMRANTTYTYSELTESVRKKIVQLVIESHYRDDEEARVRQEWAYGMYIGWRAQVMERADPTRFMHDDKLIESLLEGKSGRDVSDESSKG